MAKKVKVQTVLPVTDFVTAPVPLPAPADGAPAAAPATVQFHSPRMIPIDELRVNDWNPNVMADEEFDRLVQDIQDVGFLDALVVVPVSLDGGPPVYRILGGEHRYRAAQVLGLTALPCFVLDEPRFQDVELQKALTMRLIFVRGKPDPVKTLLVIRDLMQNHSAEHTRAMVGFVHKEQWDKLVFQMRGRLKKAGVPATGIAEFDQRATEAKTAKDLGVILRHIMDTYKSTLPYGFMVFSHHGRKHTYIATTAATQATLDRILAFSHAAGVEINTVLGPALDGVLEKLLTAPRPAPPPPPDPPA